METRFLSRVHFLFLIGLSLSTLIAIWLAVPYILFRTISPTLKPWPLAAASFCGVAIVISLRFMTHRAERRVARREKWSVGLLFSGEVLVLALSTGWPGLRRDMLALALLGASAAARALGQLEFLKKESKIRKAIAWRGTLSMVIALAVIEVFKACQSLDANLAASPSLTRLWSLLCVGSTVLAASMTACVLPIADAARGLRAQNLGWSAVARDRRDRESIFCMVVCASTAGLLFIWAWPQLAAPDYNSIHFLAACRSLNITSGVCPLSPITFTLLAVIYWAYIQLQRVTYHQDRCPVVPTLPDDTFCPKLKEVTADIERRIASSFFHPVYSAAVGILLSLIVVLLLKMEEQTVEAPSMDRFMLGAALVCGVLILLAWMRLVLIWSALREFLQQLERHPLREIFNFLPRNFLWSLIWQGGGKKRTHVAITRSLEAMLALSNNEKTPAPLKKYIDQELPTVQRSIKRLLIFAAARRRVPAGAYGRRQRKLGAIGTRIGEELEKNKWPRGS